jgi:excisionase family DNA binding protein
MKPKLESLLSEATVSVPQAGTVMGLGRNTAYMAVHRGEIPVLKFGNRLRVPTVRLRQMLSEGQAALEKQPPTKSGPTK